VIVNPGNASTYRKELDQLLSLSARYELDNGGIDGAKGEIDGAEVKVWPNLIKAAAWQESCWRQFVVKGGRVWYLESKSGDIGLMQVNKYVWRGLYSLPRLRWDIVYNASAGCEILMHLLQGAGRHVHTSDPAQLARATYAAYNGGPGAYTRWREAHEPRMLREIDEAFWAKYRAVASGQPFDIIKCAADWDRLHGD
jgi:soluble lytic murein transglycosylase-like protein